MALGAVLLLLTLSCTESLRYEFSRAGGNVTLLCENFRPGQLQCEETTWGVHFVDTPKATVELFTLGRIGSAVPHLANRFTLRDNCTLEIKAIGPEEAGLYFCRQYAQGTNHLRPDSEVTLSVVSVTESETNDDLTLECSVSSPLDVQLRWLLQGRPLQERHPEITTRLIRKGVLTATVKKTHYIKDKKDLLKCEVTHRDKAHVFSLSPTSSEKPGPPPPSPETDPDDDDKGDDGDDGEGEERGGGKPSELAGWWVALVVVAVAAVVVVFLGVVLWRRCRVKPQDTNSAPYAETEDLSYATINFTNSHQTRVRRSEEAVTYSSVRNKASDDPSQLYATVNKHNNNKHNNNNK